MLVTGIEAVVGGCLWLMWFGFLLQEVGCDMMLGSKMKVDKCHECGGDGLSCKTHDGYLDTHTLKSGEQLTRSYAN